MRFDERLGPKILAYHDLAAAYQGSVAAGRESFRRQIDFMLHLGLKFTPMSALIDSPRDHDGEIALTFDDGFSTFLETCLPVLEEHGIPATIYCVAGFAGRSGKNVSFLSWDEIKDLPGRGVDIGCHCLSHLPLDGISEEAASREVLEGTAVFRQQGIEPRTLAYPFGRYSHAAKEAVRASGYAAAVTVMMGGHDMFELRRRLVVGTESDRLLRLKLSNRFLTMREAARAVVPKRLLKQEQPIGRHRWGFEGLDRGSPDNG